MALEHLKPEIWSAALLNRLYDRLVFRNVCNTDYEGEITMFGDVVRISEIGPIAVNSYSATSTSVLTIQVLTDAQKLLNIDQQKYTAFWVDEQDRRQAKGNFMQQALQGQAEALGNNVDEYIAALYGDAGLAISGTASTGVDVTSTNVLKYVSLTAQNHDEANTPTPRWMVVPPWFAQKMLLSKIALDTSNTATLGTGALGSYMGFDIYVSNNVVHLSSTDRACILSGYRGSIALATQILTTQMMNSVTVGFKYLVKSLLVYGAKVIRPNNLGILYADYTAEAS